jgi:hypothetical protein
MQKTPMNISKTEESPTWGAEAISSFEDGNVHN